MVKRSLLQGFTNLFAFPRRKPSHLHGRKIFFEKCKKSIDKPNTFVYNSQARRIWLVGQAVKTSASHAENMGSIPVRVTKKTPPELGWCFFALVTRTWESNPAHIPTTTIHFSKQVFMQRCAHHSALVRYGDESLPHRLPWRPCRMGQIPVRVLFFFILVTRTWESPQPHSHSVRAKASLSPAETSQSEASSRTRHTSSTLLFLWPLRLFRANRTFYTDTPRCPFFFSPSIMLTPKFNSDIMRVEDRKPKQGGQVCLGTKR